MEPCRISDELPHDNYTWKILDEIFYKRSDEHKHDEEWINPNNTESLPGQNVRML